MAPTKVAQEAPPDRHQGPAARRPRQGDRPREVQLRHQPPGHAARHDPPLPARPREDQEHRHRRRREDARLQGRRTSSPRPATSSSTPATRSLAVAADTEEHAEDALRADQDRVRGAATSSRKRTSLKNPDKKTTPGPAQGQPVAAGKRGDQGRRRRRVQGRRRRRRGHLRRAGHLAPVPGVARPGRRVGRGAANLTVWASTQARPHRRQQLRRPVRDAAGQGQVHHPLHGRRVRQQVRPGHPGHRRGRAGPQGRRAGQAHARPRRGGHRRRQPAVGLRHRQDRRQEGRHHHAFEVDCYGTPGVGGGATVNLNLLPYVYPRDPERQAASTRSSALNTGSGPGHAGPGPSAELLPDRLRRRRPGGQARHRPAAGPAEEPAAQRRRGAGQATRSLDRPCGTRSTRSEIEIAAQAVQLEGASGTRRARARPGRSSTASAWRCTPGAAAAAAANDVHVTISTRRLGHWPQSSTQDLGTGQRTVTAIVVAEILGLEPSDITVQIGESQFGRSTGSGGSTTCPSHGAGDAATRPRRPAMTCFEQGRRRSSTPSRTTWPSSRARSSTRRNNKAWTVEGSLRPARHGRGQGRRQLEPATATAGQRGISNSGVGGVQVAEVMVDTETGVVRCTQRRGPCRTAA